MHCVDHINYADKGEIACYVTNFAAGDDNSEFSFGLSANIAFANMHANHGFATVAMVFRNLAPNGSANKLFFVVYATTRAISQMRRRSIVMRSLSRPPSTARADNLDPALGTPGKNFNLPHIPTNWHVVPWRQLQQDHARAYRRAVPALRSGSVRIRERAGKNACDDQLDEFRRQNQMAWKVAAVSPGIGESVKAQIETWYHRTPTGNPLFEKLDAGPVRSNAVAAGWVGFESASNSVR